MTPKKPDRWERIARVNSLGKGENKFLYVEDIVALLRNEHAWVKRMILRVAAQYKSSEGDSSAENLMLAILAELNERAK